MKNEKKARSGFEKQKKGYGNHADVGMQGSGGEMSGMTVDYVNNPKGLNPKKTATKSANLAPQEARSDVVGK